MHGILGFNLGRTYLWYLLKMNGCIRRVRFLYFVGFLDLFGVSIFLPLITHRARELGASPSVVGAIGSIYGGLQFFSSPVMGRLSDVYGRKRILLLTLFGSALGYFFTGLPTTLLLLALSRVPLGILKHSQSVSKTYLADILPPEQHARAFGNFNAFSSLGFSIGPLIGGHLAMQSNGFSKVTLLAAVIFFINFLFVWLCVKEVELEPTKAKMLLVKEQCVETGTSDASQEDVIDTKNELKETGNGNKLQSTEMTNTASTTTVSTTSNIQVASITSVLDLILIRFLMGFAMLMFRSNFTTVLEFHFGTSPRTNGYLLSYNGLVAGFCGMVVGPISKLYCHNNSRMLFHFSVLLTFSILGITFAPNILIVAFLMMPLSLSSAASRVCVTNLTFQRGSEKDKGFLLGIGNSMLSFARMLSPALGGVAMEVTVYGPGSIGAFIAIIGISVMVIYPQDRLQVLQKGKKSF